MAGGMFGLKEAYIDALQEAGFDACIIPFSGVPGGLLRRLDGIVLSGGDDLHPSYYGEEIGYELTLASGRRGDFEFRLFRECLENDKPVLAICYGMQLVNVAMGGSLFQDIARQHGTGLDHTKGFHLVSILEGSFIEPGQYRVNTSHHQAVKRLGNGIAPLAYSEDGILEAVSVSGQRFCIGVQWHPERDMSSAPNMLLFQQFREACRGA